jgi:hypothetical protein
VAKKVHRELRQEREKQIKKKLGSKYTAYKKDISAIVANIKVQLQARNVRDPSRPLRTFQHSFDQMDDNGYVDMSELNESLNDFDVKLDYDSLQTLETYLDIQMNNTFVLHELFTMIDNASRGGGKFKDSPVKKISMGKSDDDGLGMLPPNWEKGVTADGRIYFIDHAREVTQWEDPRTASRGSALNAVRAHR